MHGASAIEAVDLTVKLQGRPVLHTISFAIRRGTITGLIGPSGSGKTTLMRAIVGAQLIDEGSLQVLAAPAGDARLRPRIGYVTQSPAVYGDLTVRQNLDYFANVLGVPASRVATVIEQVDLSGATDQLVATLSGGQRARVSLGVALIGDAELLVLDEPTVGLDPILRRDLWRVFSALAAAGKTLVIASHVMDEAEQCPDLLLLRDGKILCSGSRQDVLAAGKATSVEDAFIALVEAGDA